MKNNKIVKIVIILLSLPVIWFAFWYWYEKGENEIYILPRDYRGSVIVFFDNENGKEEKYDDENNRIYEIDNSGILKTKFKFQKGKSRDIIYKSENKTLKYLYPNDILWNDTITKKNNNTYVYNAGFGNDYWFLVGSLDQIDSLNLSLEKKWNLFTSPKILKEGDSYGKVPKKTYFNK